MKEKTVVTLLILFICSCTVFAQTTELKLTETGSLTANTEKLSVIEYKGKNALRIGEDEGERVAWFTGFDFENGIIELDIAAIPSYTGLIFRARTSHIYEGIYFRPQNSWNPNPVRQGHTVQYISSPMHTWYYLREKHPEKYESYAELQPEGWFHVKVVVNGTRAEVYVNDDTEPCMVVDDLKHGITRGSVGIWAGNMSEGTFANLKVTPLPDSPMSEKQSAAEKPVGKISAEQESFLEVFRTRRSVRKFKPDPVPDEHIMAILDAARTSPTAGNQQPWKFLVLQDRDKLNRLRDMCVERSVDRAKNRPNADDASVEAMKKRAETYYTEFLSAPVYVVVLTDKSSKYPSYNVYDGAIAAGYLLVAAKLFGYGTVHSQDSIPYELIKELYEIPDNYEQICFTPIGIPFEPQKKPNKKPLREFAVFEKIIPGVNAKVVVNRNEVSLDEAVLMQYAGVYEVTPQISITVSVEGGKIFGQISGQDAFELFAESETEFFLKVTDAQIVFKKSDSGEVTGLVLHQGGQQYQGKKIK